MTGWEHSDEARTYGQGILTGERTYLRPTRESDLGDLEQWWSDPAVSVLQNSTVRPQPAGLAAEKFRAWSTNADSGSVGFSIATRSDDRLIGHVVLYGATVAARGATLAIILGPDSVGQGFGTDALRLVVRYGFQEMGCTGSGSRSGPTTPARSRRTGRWASSRRDGDVRSCSTTAGSTTRC